MLGVIGFFIGSFSDLGGWWVVGKVNVGGWGLMVLCGLNLGFDVKILMEINGLGLVIVVVVVVFISVFGMFSSSFFGVLVFVVVVIWFFSFFFGVVMIFIVVLIIGVIGSIKRWGFGNGVFFGFINGIGDFVKGDFFSWVDCYWVWFEGDSDVVDVVKGWDFFGDCFDVVFVGYFIDGVGFVYCFFKCVCY